MIKTGVTVNDLFYISEKIYKDVFVAENKITQEKYFISEIKSNECKKTLQILKGVRHPFLPEIHDIFSCEGKEYYRTSFIEGQTLSELIKSSGAALSCEKLCRYMAQVSRIIQLLHSQFKTSIFHLEIQTDTIIISDKNTVHLLNYGCSGDKINKDYEIMSKLPETANNGECSVKSDIFMIGETLHSILKPGFSKITFNDTCFN